MGDAVSLGYVDQSRAELATKPFGRKFRMGWMRWIWAIGRGAGHMSLQFNLRCRSAEKSRPVVWR